MMDDPACKRRRAFVQRAREISVRHFASAADAYDTTYGVIGPMHALCVGEFLQRLPPRAAVLDAACGTGVYFEKLAANTGRLLGIDQSEEMLARARTKWPEVETRCLALQDLHACSELGGAFHGVVCVDALEWVMRADWPKVLAGFKNVLTTEGLLYITIEIPGEEERRALAGQPEEGAAQAEVGVHYWYNHFPQLHEVLLWASQHGFHMQAHRQCTYYHHVILQLQ